MGVKLRTCQPQGNLPLRSWLSSLRAADEYAWFARDDLAPFTTTAGRMLWNATAHRLRLR